MLLTCLPLALVLTVSLGGAQTAGPPPSVTLEGTGPLPRVAEATRSHLLGAIDLYHLAIYVDGGPEARPRLTSPDVAKALRIEIRYRDDLRRRVPVDWRRELIPALEAAGTAHLRGAFAPLQHADVVLVEYVPGKGTTVRVNRSVAASDASHDLMLAFLDHWLGQRPVSDEVKRALGWPS
jgi:hypothetical protein